MRSPRCNRRLPMSARSQARSDERANVHKNVRGVFETLNRRLLFRAKSRRAD